MLPSAWPRHTLAGQSLCLRMSAMPFTRPANLSDLPALESFDQFNEVPADVLRAGPCIVAGFDDTVFAYAIISRHFFGRRFVELLFVHPDQRRKGLADALLTFAES